MKKYDISLIIGTVCIGFYATLRLAKSKLFYYSLFGLQIKPSEYKIFEHVKFFNIVICENIPQLCVQILYLIGSGSSNNDSNDYVSLIVLFSMTFSVLSIIASFLRQITPLADWISGISTKDD